MSKELVCNSGRYGVYREKLTDGSKVYSVQFQTDDGPDVIFACTSYDAARHVASSLQINTVDASIRDHEEVA